MRIRTTALKLRRPATYAGIALSVLALMSACRHNPPDIPGIYQSPGSTQAGGISAQAVPSLPASWPFSTLQLGMADSPGGAAALRQTAPFGFRYQYLSAGVNTGNGWATWNANGAFATYYIQDSVANGIVPVFTYYMMRQSLPGANEGEAQGNYDNMQNTQTMTAYYNDLKLFFQKAGAFPNNKVVLHVEPDLWGYLEQKSSGDDASTVPAQVSATGLAELAGLPNNVVGFAQAVKKLRDTYAPNVILGYHMSWWGTGDDFVYSDPSNATIDGEAQRAANFYASLHTAFDVSFSEFSDRDAAFKQVQYGDGGASWFTSADFARHLRFMADFSADSGTRIVLWQIPLGNTKMLAMNNTWDHYQDNRVEWLLDDATRQHLQDYVNAGVVAFLFGRGADGATCACDAAGDGVTNPAPINGNTGTSLSADDDGGFFRQKAAAYYTTGAMALAGGASTPTPTATMTPTPTRTPTRTPTPLPTSPPVHVPNGEAPTPLAAGPTVAGCPVFPSDNPWNQDISSMPVDANSATYLSKIFESGNGYLHADFGSNLSYGIPYVVVPQSQPLVQITYTAYGDESDPGPFPVPLNAPVEGGGAGDAHVLVVQQGACKLYELFGAQQAGSGWNAASGAAFDLRSDALRPDGWTSADAAGLPIFPGLVRYDEVASGSINHALRFTIGTVQKAWVHPATHYGTSTNTSYLPYGAKLRLKASFDTSGYYGEALVILQALKKYGMIVADQGTSWFITGASDARWDDTDLDQLKTVPGSAFEVVQLGTIYRP